jgi:hypothetical protein
MNSLLSRFFGLLVAEGYRCFLLEGQLSIKLCLFSRSVSKCLCRKINNYSFNVNLQLTTVVLVTEANISFKNVH